MRTRELSARDVVAAHLAQIERVNPRVNAIVTLTAEQAMREAAAADDALARGTAVGPLHGLPVAHKDLHETKGVRTTFGSPIYAENVPERDALIVERLKTAGGISLGKTNTPEFGAGSQTFNPVFGATLNPWDTTKTCGGSSGGAAVALACGMTALADGSDVGGSLRNPANFNNVVGFRTSLGRVPVWPIASAWQTLNVAGPMARTVEDVALMLSAITGPDVRAPMAMRESGDQFRQSLQRNFRGTRIAWSADLGGLPLDTRVAAVLAGQRGAFVALGCEVTDTDPDFSGADAAFKALRASAMTSRAELLRTRRLQLKETVIWNIEEGLKLSAEDVVQAEAERTTIFHRFREFLGPYEFLVCPVNQVPPFDVTIEYPSAIAGTEMGTYIDWMKSCYFITMTGCPAISVPCGFTPEGLPVGVQIVGRFGDELGVLQLAFVFEQATRFGTRRPPVVR
ncbi:amidase [bacterium SCGC AG-212-C10]|nr:amidase [bacterium SCGC AG-212-C10]